METRFVEVNGTSVEQTMCGDCRTFVVLNNGIRTTEGTDEKFQCWDCWRKPWQDKDIFTPNDLQFTYSELSILDEALRASMKNKLTIWKKHLNDSSTYLARDADIDNLRSKLSRIMGAIEKAPEQKGNLDGEVESIPYCY